MKILQIKLVIATVILAAGCGAQSVRSDAVPALLSEKSPQVQAKIESAISSALEGVSVTLADDALTRESLLVIERRPQHSLQHPGGLNGRKLEKPEHFRLMTDGKDCWLLQLSDSARWPLPGVSCKPEAGS